MKGNRIIALGLCLILLAVPGFATEVPEETLPPIYVGVQNLQTLPGQWDPLMERDADQEAILRLTAQALYVLNAQGQIEPAQAEELPVDVTAEFAGQYGIPKTARRGYAFAIQPRTGACWEDGSAVSVADWAFTVKKLLEQERFPLEIANYRAVLRGDTHPATEIKSLMDAGYGSVAEAQSAGYTDFYIDTSVYWGLDTGWLRTTDRTRLFDAAIPSGCEQMYVTPAYLYREYLSDSGKERMFQSEFVGIPVTPGPQMTEDEIGLIQRENDLVLILPEPMAVSSVALALTGIYPVQQTTYGEDYGTPAQYPACGPFRVKSWSGSELLLEPNPHWTGEEAVCETVRCSALS